MFVPQYIIIFVFSRGIMAINLSPMTIPIVAMISMNQAVISSCLLCVYISTTDIMYTEKAWGRDYTTL